MSKKWLRRIKSGKKILNVLGLSGSLIYQFDKHGIVKCNPLSLFISPVLKYSHHTVSSKGVDTLKVYAFVRLSTQNCLS